ncbi:phosphatase PAP2 family protein [Sporomusa sp.]|uniref:phosphatase PAP2 family protein n=1 Tax=Sporomusa sp. TaxID=2078658 RepID=UPI002C56E62F|nr:phosphatase PAP2 family protein [Sporomusa sp.]HWR44293.1 phosphatase PAP2 family protein [Sporomusa sp.]
MKALLASLDHREPLRRAIMLALVVGVAISSIVLTIQPSQDYAVYSVGKFLGGMGNDLFLILSNLLIIGWAWRKRLTSIIKLTLTLDLFVLIFVQGLKLIHLEPWYLRPNGGTGGFPSGHATHAFAMAFLLTLYFPRLAWLWYSCAAAISWSRVETNWHTGFQVTAGIVLGIILVWRLVSRWLTHPDAVIIQSQLSEEQNSPLRGQQSYATE